jgi:hypothetical protein
MNSVLPVNQDGRTGMAHPGWSFQLLRMKDTKLSKTKPFWRAFGFLEPSVEDQWFGV